MDIPINAKASCSDGPCGQSTHVILMPTTEKITHLVISNGLFRKRSISFRWIGLRKAHQS